jgi:hypothetical protein
MHRRKRPRSSCPSIEAQPGTIASLPDHKVIDAALSRPAVTEESPSQIDGAISPAAIRFERSGTGMRSDDLDDDCDHTPNRAIDQVGRVCDRTGQWQREAKKTQPQGDGGARYIFSDQFKFVHWRDAGVDQQKRDHQHRRQAKISNKCRQPLKRLPLTGPDHNGVSARAKRLCGDFNGFMTA